jgi:hypothetical protein
MSQEELGMVTLLLLVLLDVAVGDGVLAIDAFALAVGVALGVGV